MNSLFNYFTLSKNIQLSIITTMETMLDELNSYNEPKYPTKPEVEMSAEVKRLIDAGFENNKKVLEYRKEVERVNDEFNATVTYLKKVSSAHKDTVKAFQTLLAARKTYGNNTLLLPFDAFTSLLKRKNLVCGTFEDFRGDIPEENLNDILKLKEDKFKYHGVTLRTLLPVKEYQYSSEWERKRENIDNKNLDIFPFVLKTEDSHDGWWSYFSLPDRNIHFVDGTSKYFSGRITYGDSTKFFIAAPKKMFKERYKVTVKPQDPLVCALTDYGVLILTRWGEEANDKLIKRFEAFNKKLDKLNI